MGRSLGGSKHRNLHFYPRRHTHAITVYQERALASEPHGTCRSVDSEDEVEEYALFAKEMGARMVDLGSKKTAEIALIEQWIRCKESIVITVDIAMMIDGV